jgi:transposase-like protein
MAGKKGMVHYPIEVKLEAVRMFLEEGRTRAEITEILGLRSAGRVKTWVSQYRHEEDAFKKPIGRPRKPAEGAESEQEELKRLRMENALLKKFHAELRKEELAKRNIGRSTTKDKSTK